jgi:hypothetical protein
MNAALMPSVWFRSYSRSATSCPGTLAEAEEWLFLAVIVRALGLLRQSLSEMRQHGDPQIPGSIRHRLNGQVVAQVFLRK